VSSHIELGYSMNLHKIDIAQRQLDTAITLFLSEGDLCSVITLAAASEEILGCYDVGTWVKDNPDNMFNHMFAQAKVRRLDFKSKKEFSQGLVNAVKNGLKHANREEEQFVFVRPEEAVVRLLHAVINFQIGSGRPFSEPMNQFESWVRANRGEYLSGGKTISGNGA